MHDQKYFIYLPVYLTGSSSQFPDVGLLYFKNYNYDLYYKSDCDDFEALKGTITLILD